MAHIYEEICWFGVRELFRKWREDNERRSDEIVQLWDAVLEDKLYKVGNERHLILEQVIIAAFDCDRIEIVDKCIKELVADFPGSLRLQKYKAMRFEVLEQFDEAIDVLDEIIKTDETNSAPRKRKVAILKAKGRVREAIKELCDYLKKFMSDQEAWLELCNLYLQEGDFSKASFCMEEMILHNPHSHLIHQRLAEIRYTMGGTDNIEIAKSYYAKAVKLNSNNLRALYGLYLCCNHITNSKAAISKRKDAQSLSQWAMNQVSAKTIKCSKVGNNEKYIIALEGVFGNLEIKSI